MAPATTSSEEEAPAPAAPASDKPEDRSFGIRTASVLSILVLGLAVYFLLEIHAPSFALWLAGGSAVSTTGAVAAWAVLQALAKVGALSKDMAELSKRVTEWISGLLGKRRLALGLVAGALGMALLTSVYRWTSARCPILRVKPGSALTYLLRDPADEQGKKPEKTYAIVVEIQAPGVRDWTTEGRFLPRNEGAFDIGASKGVLRWRAAREQDKGAQLFLGTRRFHPGDKVRINFRCQGSNADLFEPVVRTIEAGQDLLTSVRLDPKREKKEDFNRRTADCDPIDTN